MLIQASVVSHRVFRAARKSRLKAISDSSVWSLSSVTELARTLLKPRLISSPKPRYAMADATIASPIVRINAMTAGSIRPV